MVHATATREQLRRTYQPDRTIVLFVGESPPARGSFFYAADSELYRATRDAFLEVLPDSGKCEFLTYFASIGCYLEDLSHEPVNQLVDRRDGSWQRRLEARREGEQRLAKTLASLRPRVIIALLKGIESNVERAAKIAGCTSVERHTLTYPSRWHKHRVAYHRELTALVRDLLRGGVLKSDSYGTA